MVSIPPRLLDDPPPRQIEDVKSQGGRKSPEISLEEISRARDVPANHCWESQQSLGRPPGVRSITNEKGKQRTDKFTTRELTRELGVKKKKKKKKQSDNYFMDESGSPLHCKELLSPLRMHVVKEGKEFLGPGEAWGK